MILIEFMVSDHQLERDFLRKKKEKFIFTFNSWISNFVRGFIFGQMVEKYYRIRRFKTGRFSEFKLWFEIFQIIDLNSNRSCSNEQPAGWTWSLLTAAYYRGTASQNSHPKSFWFLDLGIPFQDQLGSWLYFS